MLNALGCSAVTGPAVNTTEGKRRAFTLFFISLFFFETLEKGGTDLRRARVPPARG